MLSFYLPGGGVESLIVEFCRPVPQPLNEEMKNERETNKRLIYKIGEAVQSIQKDLEGLLSRWSFQYQNPHSNYKTNCISSLWKLHITKDIETPDWLKIKSVRIPSSKHDRTTGMSPLRKSYEDFASDTSQPFTSQKKLKVITNGGGAKVSPWLRLSKRDCWGNSVQWMNSFKSNRRMRLRPGTIHLASQLISTMQIGALNQKRKQRAPKR